MQLVLTPALIKQAYLQGLFPMAYSAGSPYIHWVCPEMRGQLSIAALHIPRRLKKTVRQNLKKETIQIKINTDFLGTIKGCAEAAPDRPETWINDPIRSVFYKMHKKGWAHSVECWQDKELVGGLYGLAIGGVFFGESMFSRVRDASKIALVHLAARLYAGGFQMLDTQFTNDHLQQFGVYERPYKDFLIALEDAVSAKTDFVLKGRSETELLNNYFEMRSNQR